MARVCVPGGLGAPPIAGAPLIGLGSAPAQVSAGERRHGRLGDARRLRRSCCSAIWQLACLPCLPGSLPRMCCTVPWMHGPPSRAAAARYRPVLPAACPALQLLTVPPSRRRLLGVIARLHPSGPHRDGAARRCGAQDRGEWTALQPLLGGVQCVRAGAQHAPAARCVVGALQAVMAGAGARAGGQVPCTTCQPVGPNACLSGAGRAES